MDATEFKNSLRVNTPQFMVQRFLFDEFPYAFVNKQDEYFQFRDRICQHFNIHPNDFTVVGSGKLGFSVNPKPEKLWRSFSDASDIDIVLVSDVLFQKVWLELLKIGNYKLLLTKTQKENYEEFKRIFFYGMLRPDKMPPKFPFTKVWWDFFNEMSKHPLSGRRRTRAALFKSWDHVSLYYEKNFENLKRKELQSNEGDGN